MLLWEKFFGADNLGYERCFLCKDFDVNKKDYFYEVQRKYFVMLAIMFT